MGSRVNILGRVRQIDFSSENKEIDIFISKQIKLKLGLLKNVFKWAFRLCNFRQQYFFALFRCIKCYNNLCLSIDITYLDIIQLIICSFKLYVIFRFHNDVFQVQPGIVNGALNLMSF